MNKGVVAFVLGVFLVLVLVVSCPERTRHTEVLTNEVTQAFGDKLREESKDTESVSKEAAESLFGELFGEGLMRSVSSFAIDNLLLYNTYFVFSTGSIRYQGESHIVTVGVLNMVFVLADVDELLDKLND